MNNVGAIPPIRAEAGDFVWNRGFNVVVVDRLGAPKFFCKCRSLHDERLAHETESMVALRGAPNLKQHIPPILQAQSERLRILVTPFLAGKPLNDVLGRHFNQRRARLARIILDAVVDLAVESTRALPDLLQGANTVDLGQEASELLAYLGRIGLSDADLAVLEGGFVVDTAMPSQLQHGDLWAANVMRARKHFWFLDFEMFGRVRVPMYDVFHFLRTCADRWTGPAWIDHIKHGGDVSELQRVEIGRAATKLGLTARQAAAALVFYVAHFAVTTHRRNPAGQVWRLFFQEAQLLTNHLQQGYIDELMAKSMGGV